MSRDFIWSWRLNGNVPCCLDMFIDLTVKALISFVAILESDPNFTFTQKYLYIFLVTHICCEYICNLIFMYEIHYRKYVYSLMIIGSSILKKSNINSSQVHFLQPSNLKSSPSPEHALNIPVFYFFSERIFFTSLMSYTAFKMFTKILEKH